MQAGLGTRTKLSVPRYSAVDIGNALAECGRDQPEWGYWSVRGGARREPKPREPSRSSTRLLHGNRIRKSRPKSQAASHAGTQAACSTSVANHPAMR
jgi:hypothetical protein